MCFHCSTCDWWEGFGRRAWESSTGVWEWNEENARAIPGWTRPQDKASVRYGEAETTVWRTTGKNKQTGKIST